MRSSWFIAGALIVVGFIWIGQGLGILGGSSFMTGERVWAWLGVGLIVAGVGTGIWAFTTRPRP